MSYTDWTVLIITLIAITFYGLHKGRDQKDAASYILANNQMPWYVVLLGIMATQASAITFISAPGQAFSDGMRFIQYYFGLPLAMIVICVTFIPYYQKLNIYTAYEYLERRFNRKTRYFTAFLFLMSRALSTGISIYAPSIILSGILGWNIYATTLITGGVLVIYTTFGGASAVAHTQKVQLIIILASIAIAGYMVVHRMPQGVGFGDALYLAGKSGKLNIITTDFNWKDKYNIWSGLIGGFFLALSYFGTDQSQVGRYLSAKDIRSARLGLLMNGLIKIPMQFGILLIGALLFSFYSLYNMPLTFNKTAESSLESRQPIPLQTLRHSYETLQKEYQKASKQLLKQRSEGVASERDAVRQLSSARTALEAKREEFNSLVSANNIRTDKSDVNYIFLSFVKDNLPAGLVGLLFAAIFLASWGSISAALNSMTSCSLIDFHFSTGSVMSTNKQLWYARAHTLVWGVFSVAMAMLASKMGSLIEAVNILGSLFYGTILGIFLVGFYLKRVQGREVLYAAICTQALILLIYSLDIVSFLWLNAVGALCVPAFGLIFTIFTSTFTTIHDKQR